VTPGAWQRFLPTHSKSGQRRLVRRCRTTGALLSAAVPVAVRTGNATVTSGRAGRRLGDVVSYIGVCDQARWVVGMMGSGNEGVGNYE
jgi:hypothetical protein